MDPYTRCLKPWVVLHLCAQQYTRCSSLTLAPDLDNAVTEHSHQHRMFYWVAKLYKVNLSAFLPPRVFT